MKIPMKEPIIFEEKVIGYAYCWYGRIRICYFDKPIAKEEWEQGNRFIPSDPMLKKLENLPEEELKIASVEGELKVDEVKDMKLATGKFRGPNGQIIYDKKRISLKKGQDVTEAVWTEKDEK